MKNPQEYVINPFLNVYSQRQYEINFYRIKSWKLATARRNRRTFESRAKFAFVDSIIYKIISMQIRSTVSFQIRQRGFLYTDAMSILRKCVSISFSQIHYVPWIFYSPPHTTIISSTARWKWEEKGKLQRINYAHYRGKEFAEHRKRPKKYVINDLFLPKIRKTFLYLCNWQFIYV